MSIAYEDFVAPNIRRIFLVGRLDISGTDALATQFAALASGSDRKVLVDMSGVDFLSSIGIRMLITSAKANKQRGGHMVLMVPPSGLAYRSLEMAGIGNLIPIYTDATSARDALVA